ncbi:hypothetical protein PAECIP112173_02517 [Paenibacillus sp. JJ-100]|nr:hypothetical protein PAECIP112173_02517 [Paenibacillus sp. JJ-100]
MEGSNEKPTVGIKPVTVGLLFVWMYMELKVTLNLYSDDLNSLSTAVYIRQDAIEVYKDPAVVFSVPPFLRYWAGEMPIIFLNAVLK